MSRCLTPGRQRGGPQVSMGPKPKVRRVQHVVHFGRWGYSVDRTFAGQTALQGRFARGRSRLGGWPGEEGGLGGTRFGCGSATRSR